MNAALPTVADVRAAATRLATVAVATPVLESPRLNARTGGRLLIKPEVLQRTGSFKFRGAYNRLSQLDEEERKRGVVAFSSGNHAQGVAAAARILGIPATIVMPADAPTIKIENTKADGATVVLYERADGNRVEVAGKLVAESGATLVPPYDDFHVIAGQGTVGLEFAAQARGLDTALDALVIPCSGGGLSAGCALAFKSESPPTEVYCAEPVGFDDTARSLAAGERLENKAGASSICDALLLETPGALTFALNKDLLAGGFAVTDDAVRNALRIAAEDLKLVVEPSGAIALAAVLEGMVDGQGRTVGVVLSGGNVDMAFHAELMAG